jgi:hypothetical protein
MKKTTILSFATAVVSAAIVSFVAYGCGDDETPSSPKADSGNPETSSGGSSGGSSGSSGTDSATTPPKPTLGAQIDRMGRPGINTALQETFTADGTREAAQNAYNTDSDKANWVSKYKANFAKSLAIYDGIVACGDQAFASADAAADGSVEKYGTLAGVLADDRLWLDTSATCGDKYLSVELNATGAIANTDCGGRTLKVDVIDVTYTALASDPAALADPDSYVGDKIARQEAKTNGTTFPYLAAPQ